MLELDGTTCRLATGGWMHAHAEARMDAVTSCGEDPFDRGVISSDCERG